MTGCSCMLRIARSCPATNGSANNDVEWSVGKGETDAELDRLYDEAQETVNDVVSCIHMQTNHVRLCIRGRRTTIERVCTHTVHTRWGLKAPLMGAFVGLRRKFTRYTYGGHRFTAEQMHRDRTTVIKLNYAVGSKWRKHDSDVDELHGRRRPTSEWLAAAWCRQTSVDHEAPQVVLLCHRIILSGDHVYSRQVRTLPCLWDAQLASALIRTRRTRELAEGDSGLLLHSNNNNK